MHSSFYIFVLCLTTGWLSGVIMRRASRIPGFLDDGF